MGVRTGYQHHFSRVREQPCGLVSRHRAKTTRHAAFSTTVLAMLFFPAPTLSCPALTASHREAKLCTCHELN